MSYSHSHAKSMKTPLGIVRGLGSAKNGTAHWWAQRTTAIALFPLGLWFVWRVLPHAGSDYAAFVAYLQCPCETVLMILLIGASLYHGQLGLQVVIEDYVHCDALKIILILGVKALVLVLGVWGVLSVLIIQFKHV